MLSRTQDVIVNAGSKIYLDCESSGGRGLAGSGRGLDCEFHMENFSMFDNPIVLEKHQLGERTKLNIMGVVQLYRRRVKPCVSRDTSAGHVTAVLGVVQEPFASTRRYDIILVQQPP